MCCTALGNQKPADLSTPKLISLFRLVLYATDSVEGTPEEYGTLMDILEKNNMTYENLVKTLSPDCESQIKRCKWKGRYERCNKLFKKVQTAFGVCCSFNEVSLKKTHLKRKNIANNEDVEYITSCVDETGLTVLLDPDIQDYQFSARKTAGFQILIHDNYNYVHRATKYQVVPPSSINRFSVLPSQTHSTDYIRALSVETRRCYWHDERKLFYFPTYSQSNCLVECRSHMLYEKCGCTLWKWPKKDNWRVCGLKERQCYQENRELLETVLQSVSGDYRNNYYAEKFMCGCYPSCDFNQYAFYSDSGKFDRRFSMSDKRFFKDINITQHILLQVFYEELYAERLRYDVIENWLSFIGTFGGITGLHMGYSVVSGFEMIFFVFVRPACNWLTKKQIRYRIKRRQRKAKIEADKNRKAEEEKEKQERIEAFLRMRPYCPGY